MGLISWRYSFDSSRRFRRDRIQVNGQREPRRRGVANFYFNFQVWDMIGFVPCKKINATFSFGSKKRVVSVSRRVISPSTHFFFKLENVFFFFLSFLLSSYAPLKCHNPNASGCITRSATGNRGSLSCWNTCLSYLACAEVSTGKVS